MDQELLVDFDEIELKAMASRWQDWHVVIHHALLTPDRHLFINYWVPTIGLDGACDYDQNSRL